MIIMGRIAAAQGLLGWVAVKTYTDAPDNLAAYPEWWLGDEKTPWREAAVERCALHSKGLVAKLAGCHDRTDAEKLKGLLVAVPRSSLPQQREGEYYWADLIGLQVVNLAGASLGVVDNLMDTGASQVLCVRGSEGEVLIPFIASAIKDVDLAGKIIRVDWLTDESAQG